MSIKGLAICDRCFRQESMPFESEELPIDWSTVTFEQSRGRKYISERRTQHWCPRCSGLLHNLFLLGYTVVKEPKDSLVNTTGELR